MTKLFTISAIVLLCLGFYLVWQNKHGWKIISQEEEGSHTVPIQSIFFFNSSFGFGVKEATLQKTIDGGRTWTEVIDNKNGDIFPSTVFFIDDKRGFVLGSETRENYQPKYGENDSRPSSERNKPLIMQTSHQGQTWQKVKIDENQFSDKNNTFSDLYGGCLDPKGNLWIISDKGIAQGTIQDNSFQTIQSKITKTFQSSIACAENNDIWVISGGNLIFYNSQTGWKEIPLNENSRFWKVKVIGQDIWVMGSCDYSKENSQTRGCLLKKTNQTWEEKTPLEAKKVSRENNLRDLSIINGKGWLIGNQGAIYYTEDNGENWIKQANLTSNNLLNLFFLNESTGWASGEVNTLLQYQK